MSELSPSPCASNAIMVPSGDHLGETARKAAPGGEIPQIGSVEARHPDGKASGTVGCEREVLPVRRDLGKAVEPLGRKNAPRRRNPVARNRGAPHTVGTFHLLIRDDTRSSQRSPIAGSRDEPHRFRLRIGTGVDGALTFKRHSAFTPDCLDENTISRLRASMPAPPGTYCSALPYARRLPPPASETVPPTVAALAAKTQWWFRPAKRRSHNRRRSCRAEKGQLLPFSRFQRHQKSESGSPGALRSITSRLFESVDHPTDRLLDAAIRWSDPPRAGMT